VVLSETKEGSPQFDETATAGMLRVAQNDRMLGFFRSLDSPEGAPGRLRWLRQEAHWWSAPATRNGQ